MISMNQLFCFILLNLVTPPSSPTPDGKKSTRRKRCPSCHIQHHQHTFGLPGPNCPGQHSPELQQSSATILDNEIRNDGAGSEQIEFYKTQLLELQDQERELQKSIEDEEGRLLAEIEAKQRKIERLRASRKPSPPPPSPSTLTPLQHRDAYSTHQQSAAIFPSFTVVNSSANIPHMSTLPSALPNTIARDNCFESVRDRLPVPVSHNILQQHPRQAQQQQHQVSHFLQNPSSVLSPTTLHTPSTSANPFESEIFIRPTRMTDATRGKPLRITDFVSRLRPNDDEKVLSCDNYCKLTLSLNDTKPKLTSISVEQYNIANLRIFYEFLYSKKLVSMQDVRDYLSFSVKVLELATKYTWESVLLYDDEFRILQHTYGFPWSTDNSHLHEVVLIPRWAAALPRSLGHTFSSPKSNSNGSGSILARANTLSHLSNGLEICRMFNSRKGCQKSPCKFSHACNRKVGSQACGKPHPGCLHPGDSPGQ